MKLNGYTLKAVKTMETTDGVAYTGNIYFDGKKIGMAYNDGRGGMTDVSLVPGIAGRAAHDAALTEDCVERLFTLHDYEDMFRANTRGRPEKGMAFVTYSDPLGIDAFLCGKDATLDEISAQVNKQKPGWEIGSIEIFRSLDDFMIDESRQQEQADGGQDFTGDPGEESGGMTMKMQ